ncbi:MAG: hypothetical protein NTX24_02660 [Candidatus Pacearchaeota archaeon]|nr:hypothetical protein [Candidatus Pacearchaeota archaeon]
MNKTQWFVLSGILILSGIYIIFAGMNWGCIQDSFNQFADSQSSQTFYMDYAPNEYDLVQCAVGIKMSYILVYLAFFLGVVCAIMGFLELKKKV